MSRGDVDGRYSHGIDCEVAATVGRHPEERMSEVVDFVGTVHGLRLTGWCEGKVKLKKRNLQWCVKKVKSVLKQVKNKEVMS